MSKHETQGRIRPLPLKDALAVLDELVHEAEDAYGRSRPGERKEVARRLVALGMARAALAEMEGKPNG